MDKKQDKESRLTTEQFCALQDLKYICRVTSYNHRMLVRMGILPTPEPIRKSSGQRICFNF